MEQLASGVSEELFKAQSSAGFLVDRQSSTHLEGRYVQRVVTNEQQTDPFGKEYQQEYVYYIEQRFALSSTWPQLVIFNSSTALRTLISRLSEFSGFTLAIKDLKWNPDEILHALAIQVPDVRVTTAKVENIRVSLGVQVKMTFAGSDSDIREDVRKYLRRNEFLFSSYKVSFTHAGGKHISEIKANGVIQNHGEYDPALTSLWLKVMHDLRSKMQP